jgi:hypothetical protein
LKIIRVENGSLQTVVGKFLGAHGNAIGGKDVVLIGSASQLLREGVAGYIESYLETADRIAAGPRKDCLVLPAPMILLGGCSEPTLLRAMFDFHAWVRISGADPDGLLNDALRVIEHRIQNEGGEKAVWTMSHYKLPLGLPNKRKTATYSEGPTNLPKGVGPFPIQTEKLVITSLLGNISEKYKPLGIILDCDPFTISANCEGANSVKECPNIIVIGGDHAEQTAVALQKSGARVKLLHVPSYRTSQLHAGKLREGLACLAVEADTWLVVQVFDSGLYMASPAEGGLIPPCRRADGNVHVDGNLVLLTKDLQYELFKQIEAELSEFKHMKILFMAPLPRYVSASCCNDSDHIANRRLPDFQRKLEDGIFGARTNIKNFAYRHGFRNSTTISSWGKIKKMDNVWADAVKLQDGGYEKIAAAILEAGEDLGRKRKNTNSSKLTPPSKKARTSGGVDGGGRGGSSNGGGRGGGASNVGASVAGVTLI